MGGSEHSSSLSKNIRPRSEVASGFTGDPGALGRGTTGHSSVSTNLQRLCGTGRLGIFASVKA